MTTINTARLRVTGRVQGVFYRQSARDKARALGLCGWVRNTEDGAVELEVWGTRDRVEELISWCHCGPPAAKVSGVTIEWRDEGEPVSDRPQRFEITD